MAYGRIATVVSLLSVLQLQQQGHAFSTSTTTSLRSPQRVLSSAPNRVVQAQPQRQATALNALYNTNEAVGASPFGFATNAETWNGRVAQVSFVWIFFQEFVQGKGMLKGLEDGDFINMVSLGVFGASVAALTACFLAEPPAGAPGSGVRAPGRVELDPVLAFTRGKGFGSLFDPNNSDDDDDDGVKMNFNDRRSPYGFKKNAEIWNGRIAMVSFAWVFMQEFLQGEGMISSLEKSDMASMSSLFCFLALLNGFSIMMASVQTDDFVERVVGREALQMNADADWKPETVEPPYELPQVTSVAPGTGGSDPVTYEAYMKLREEAEEKAARIKAAKEAQIAQSSFSKSLKAMSSEPLQPVTGSFQIYAATNPRPITTVAPTSSLEEVSFSDALKTMTSSSSGSSSSTGASFPPTVVKAGTRAAVESTTYISSYSNIASSAPVIGSGTVQSTDPSPHPEGEFKFTSALKGLVKPSQSTSSYVDTYKIEGYRFKPDTQSAIGSSVDTSPHPEGNFSFSSDTSERIQPKPKYKPSKTHPVEGFKFADSTKTVIQTKERNTAVVPEVSTSSYEMVKPQVAYKPSQIHPVEGFKFGDVTKTVIQSTERNTAVIPKEEPIVSPNFSNLNVMAQGSGQPMITVPTGNTVSSSYESLYDSYRNAQKDSNGGQSDAPETPASSNEMVGAAVQRGSYLESLSRSSNSGSSSLQP